MSALPVHVERALSRIEERNLLRERPPIEDRDDSFWNGYWDEAGRATESPEHEALRAAVRRGEA